MSEAAPTLTMKRRRILATIATVALVALVMLTSVPADAFASRPMLALWLEHEGMRVGKSLAPALRFAIWPDGRVVFAEGAPKFGTQLQEGRITIQEVKKLRDAIMRSDLFTMKREAALVPDAPSMCLLVDAGEKRRLSKWDEYEAPGYGISNSSSPDDRKFIATWKLLNQLGLGVRPKALRPLDSKFQRPPANWYLREKE